MIYLNFKHIILSIFRQLYFNFFINLKLFQGQEDAKENFSYFFLQMLSK